MSRTHATDDVIAGQSGRGQLLCPDDPAPVEVCHARSKSPVVLLCEHAGQAIPQALNGLGLPDGAIDQHIGWDIGAGALARAVSDRLRCPLIIQRYSRLVIDCNRPPGSEASVPEASDGVRVPGNAGLGPKDLAERTCAIFNPMNAAIDAAFDAHPRQAAFSIHSFTRHFQGQDRPWDAGFLTRRDRPTARVLMTSISRKAADLELALNQPYQIEDATDWFIPRHAEPRGVRHTLIEVRNDHLRDEAGVAHWADLLADAIHDAVAEARP
ncbi:N-formylglutamate amidohydrolase [Pseudaestuariivita atlantica]|uniref:N-formylglutamate amidohydrolase n=1 Tax=Pseudaestuariivita atlantica TaxID=1317121 RepID=A0A0L1JSE2_9RHOB|nr:N-formylglutamate amidohydrolase [Pseudaestuariivita atlantica]KNG94622.1 N-formylglutamate amidohydrolase [Pseudaestuariivita atlantica]